MQKVSFYRHWKWDERNGIMQEQYIMHIKMYES